MTCSSSITVYSGWSSVGPLWKRREKKQLCLKHVHSFHMVWCKAEIDFIRSEDDRPSHVVHKYLNSQKSSVGQTCT